MFVAKCIHIFHHVDAPSVVETSTYPIQGQISITDLDGSPAVFVAEMNITGSAEREALIARIRPLVIISLEYESIN